ncbi:D-Ala-D-Ala carboxypeptidase family metallohydrolase [Phascolarctobacterium faecium]|uniref:D-Ala-D-Ala carboxypeptidase family metallohydrolase n=1 Tax=Phascolarctobacterium faecium TaxID=33025 RepID=UPI0032C0A283
MINTLKLSEHFDSSEFACKCGCGGLNNGAGVNPRLVQVLERMRQLCGSPLELSCAYRCPNHNAEVGGVWNSQHVYGIAADVQTPPGLTPEELLRVAEQAGADGIGLYTWGVHVDVRGYAARW